MLCPVLSARKRSQCLISVSMSGCTLSPKLSTVALQRSKSSAFVHGGGRIELPRNIIPSIYALSFYLSIYLSAFVHGVGSQSHLETLHLQYTLSICASGVVVWMHGPNKTSLLFSYIYFDKFDMRVH